jgi:hypothetical protein
MLLGISYGDDIEQPFATRRGASRGGGRGRATLAAPTGGDLSVREP